VYRGLSVLAGCLAVGAAASVAGVARGGAARSEVASVFFIAKSENRNQVHYGVRLDAACAPADERPVFAYWRMLERGPLATEPLLSREVGAYGFADQHVLERTASGGRVSVRLHALPARPIELVTRAHDGSCEAVATTVIGGAPASLARVYAQLRWPFGVDYLELSGRALADGRPLRERLSD
jgi:hypothetical protein